MSKLSSVCGKSKIFKIEGIDIELKANFLTIDDLPSLLVLAAGKQEIDEKTGKPVIDGQTGLPKVILTQEEKEQQGKILAELVPRILKKSIPDASDEEIKEFALRNLKQLTEAIVEISGLDPNAPD